MIHGRSKRRGRRFTVAGAILLAGCVAVALTLTSVGSARSTKQIKVAMVPKLLGLPVFEANVKGAKQVAPGLGIKLLYTAPATASAQGQVAIFDSLIRQKYDVIALSSDDPTTPAPVLQKAMAAGIKVISWDSDVIPSARSFFIQNTAYDTFAKDIIDGVVKLAGSNAHIAIMNSTPDATIQLSWLKAMHRYMAAKYPNLKIVTTGYGQSNQALSLTQAENIIHSHPDVKAIIPIDGAATTGTGQAVSNLHLQGKVFVVGIGDPLPNVKYLEDGSIQALVLWDEVKEGQMVMYVSKLAYEGKLVAGKTFTCPLGKFTVSATTNPITGATKNTIIFSKPLTFTKENYKKYMF